MRLPREIAEKAAFWHVSGAGIYALVLAKAAVAGKRLYITDIALSGDAATLFSVADNPNLLTANQASVETNTTGFSAAASATVSRDTTEYYHGAASLKAITNGAGANEGQGMVSINVAPSLMYTGSVYLKGSGTVTLRLSERDSSDVAVGTTTSSVITLTNTWTRYSVTRLFGATGVKARLVAQTDTTQAITYYVDALQIEQAAAASDWALPDNLFSARRAAGGFAVRKRFRVPLVCGLSKAAYLHIDAATANCEANMSGFTLED